MKSSRRTFLHTAAAAATSGAIAGGLFHRKAEAAAPTKAALDKILVDPVLNLDAVKDPVIVESIELLKNGRSYVVRTRSTAGVEVITVPHQQRIADTAPIFLKYVVPVFLKKDARQIESLMWDVYRHDSNYKLQGIGLWVPVAALEMALLELMAQTAKRPIADFFGGVKKRDIPVYYASGVRGNRPEEEIQYLRKLQAEAGAKALKFRLGGMMNRNLDSLPGRTEALIPMVRKEFGDQMTLYADSNSSYDVPNAIRIGRIMEAHGYGFYEEPCEFDDLWETKEVADALSVPIAAGEQEYSLRRFRWTIENRAVDIIQPDLHYGGGLIRATKVARMAAAVGMEIVPHMSGGGLGYVEVVHFASFTPNIGPFQEFKGGTDIPVECATSSLKPEQGIVRCPTGLGFGVQIAADFVAKAKQVTLA